MFCAQCGNSGQPVRPGADKNVFMQTPPPTVSAPLISNSLRFSIFSTGTGNAAEACRSAPLLSGEVAVTCGFAFRRHREPSSAMVAQDMVVQVPVCRDSASLKTT